MNCTSCSCATTELTTMLQCPLCPSPSQTSWGNSWPARTTTSPVWPRTTHRPWSSGGSWGTSTCPPPPTTRWCFPLVSFENMSQNCPLFIKLSQLKLLLVAEGWGVAAPVPAQHCWPRQDAEMSGLQPNHAFAVDTGHSGPWYLLWVFLSRWDSF